MDVVKAGLRGDVSISESALKQQMITRPLGNFLIIRIAARWAFSIHMPFCVRLYYRCIKLGKNYRFFSTWNPWKCRISGGFYMARPRKKPGFDPEKEMEGLIDRMASEYGVFDNRDSRIETGCFGKAVHTPSLNTDKKRWTLIPNSLIWQNFLLINIFLKSAFCTQYFPAP